MSPAGQYVLAAMDVIDPTGPKRGIRDALDREDHLAVEGGDKAAPTTSGGATNSVVAEIAAYSSSWSGRYAVEDHIRIIRVVAPRAMKELSALIDMVEARRFNDRETQDALDLLRALHHDLGLLIDAVENAKFKSLLVRIARKGFRSQ